MSQALATEFLCPDRVFDGQSLLTGRALGFFAGKVLSLDLVKDVPPGAARHRFDGTIAAGFLDLQVNGGGDVFLNSNPTVDGMAAIAAAHRRFGTVGILPTLITDTPEVLAQAVDAALAAQGMPGILGLHIEGPHISVTRRGTHAARFVRPMDASTLAHVTRLRGAPCHGFGCGTRSGLAHGHHDSRNRDWHAASRRCRGAVIAGSGSAWPGLARRIDRHSSG